MTWAARCAVHGTGVAMSAAGRAWARAVGSASSYDRPLVCAPLIAQIPAAVGRCDGATLVIVDNASQRPPMANVFCVALLEVACHVCIAYLHARALFVMRERGMSCPRG
eukprot:4231037-Pyramimonas_sp.AAC.1